MVCVVFYRTLTLRDSAYWRGVPAQLNPVVLHVGASGAAPDWAECGAAQQFHILGTPAAAARTTWRHPPGALSPAKAHQGLCFISLHCCLLQLCGPYVRHPLGTSCLRLFDSRKEVCNAWARLSAKESYVQDWHRTQHASLPSTW